jgi:hypothetical protein
MIVSVYQPYFAPFAGFFAKALQSDILVLLDTVQFPRGTTWLTRNRFKNDQGTLFLTIPVWKRGLGLQRIHEVNICHEGRWAQKHLASLKTAYKHAPFFEDHEDVIEGLFTGGFDRLIDLNLTIIRHLMVHLRIPARVVLLSELDIDINEPRLSVDICKTVGATHFLAQTSAGRHLDPGLFERAGISLEFFTPRPPVYPQLWGPFIPNLSAFDLLFTCGPKAHDVLQKNLRGPH